MRPTSNASRRPRGVLVVAALTAGAVALLTACGGASASGSGTAKSPSAATGTRGGFANGPAASGRIAEIDGNTLQVQNDTTGQVAVAVTDKTTYTQTEATTLASVRVGSCVSAISAVSDSGSSTAPGDSPPTTITADTVVVSSATDGSCTRGFAGSAGPRGSFTGVPSRFRQSGAPTGRPSGAPGQLPRTAAVNGLVTAVSGSTITVRAERRALPSGSTATPTATPTPTATATATASTVTVLVTASTKYTETVAATKAALKVGLCLTAEGSTGSDGTVTASRIALSAPSATGCTVTFGRGRFGAGGPGGPGDGSGAGSGGGVGGGGSTGGGGAGGSGTTGG